MRGFYQIVGSREDDGWGVENNRGFRMAGCCVFGVRGRNFTVVSVLLAMF